MGYLYGIYGIYIYQIYGLVVPSSLLCGDPPASPLADKPQSFSSELPYILPASQPCLSSSSEICKDNAHIHQNDDQYSEITKSTNQLRKAANLFFRGHIANPSPPCLAQLVTKSLRWTRGSLMQGVLKPGHLLGRSRLPQHNFSSALQKEEDTMSSSFSCPHRQQIAGVARPENLTIISFKRKTHIAYYNVIFISFQKTPCGYSYVTFISFHENVCNRCNKMFAPRSERDVHISRDGQFCLPSM